MNILLVSLLRAGDLLMHIKALTNLTKNPDLNIYLLTHRQNQGLEFLFPWVKKIFYFDRELVQKSQKEDFLPLDSGFLHTMKLISELNEISFQTIYNFTNTKISALLINLINGREKIGLVCNDQKYSVNDPNLWIQYLNNTENSKFHLIDIFNKSLINNKFLINSKEPRFTPSNSAKPIKEKTICIQSLTSDPKKNWPLKNWNQLINKLSLQFTDYSIYLLCSNAEKTKLFEAFPDHLSKIFVSTYKEAFELISSSLILITGDTSIKHLASFTDTKVLELAIGSAKPTETGVYSPNGYLLYNPTSCQPCKHSSDCSESFRCQNTISVHDVFESVNFILKQNNLIPKILYKTDFNQNSLLTYELVSGAKSSLLSNNYNKELHHAE